MDINRRQLLVGTAWTALTGALGATGSDPVRMDPGVTGTEGWHPLTRSLLERARKAGRGRQWLQISQVERSIRDQARAHGWAESPVIKWQPGASEAFDDLSQRGLQALLSFGFASFWHGAGPSVPFDEDAFERVYGLRRVAAHIMRVEDHDLALMRPKLLAKSRAMQSHASAEASFDARAVAAQIGWLETSLPSLAADAIVNIELLLSLGFTESDERTSHQLRAFAAYESGLLATWETPGMLICVPRLAGACGTGDQVNCTLVGAADDDICS